MKKWVYLGILSALLAACGGAADQQNAKTGSEPAAGTGASSNNPSYDPNRGEGKFTNVKIAQTLDPAMAEAGNKIYTVKCAACHKTTDEKLVGPGWKGVTERHTPEWIMNFATNPDAMLDKDPKAQAMLEICLVRMPNQHLSDEEARSVFEFMRKNDGVK